MQSIFAVILIGIIIGFVLGISGFFRGRANALIIQRLQKQIRELQEHMFEQRSTTTHADESVFMTTDEFITVEI